jgi:hypothetical protein
MSLLGLFGCPRNLRSSASMLMQMRQMLWAAAWPGNVGKKSCPLLTLTSEKMLGKRALDCQGCVPNGSSVRGMVSKHGHAEDAAAGNPCLDVHLRCLRDSATHAQNQHKQNLCTEGCAANIKLLCTSNALAMYQ